MMSVEPGDKVWFRPASIGYGYVYGPDRGIPAVITKLHVNRVTISFQTKTGGYVPERIVAMTNIEPRDS